ncbi:exonuclease domain-containing protein [Pseudoalteromonas holothuriae]|uniref:exonuclease domain-containing protein n=1 Tax=Pseudoalteromonas holothuriae TaxID=2963714 RepID=UPI0021C2503A|nr:MULTISPECIES: exonuclease domain-containing protein [unclassified Pseudoalteromonas]
MKKQLPEKYYLDHFSEFIAHTRHHNMHLLCDEHFSVLERIDNLAENERCLMVRLLNRTSSFVAHTTLKYKEINNLPNALKVLRQQELITDVNLEKFEDWLSVITKPELMALCNVIEAVKLPSRTAKKSCWFEFAKRHLVFDDVVHHEVVEHYLYICVAPQFEYFLFLYFNRLERNLSQFSMRDLGVMKTHSKASGGSYFENRQFALCAYRYAKYYQRLQDSGIEQSAALANLLLREPIDADLGVQANYQKEKVFYKLACLLEKSHINLAMQLLEQCTSAKAQEKWVRLLYTQGEHECCKASLEAILNTPNDEHLLLFAKDFLLRKFAQKRTSILTDLLREHSHIIAIDEAYKGNTEQGMIAHYKRNGVCAWHTENHLWLALFSIVFWQELYESEHSMPCNEFERYPQMLKLNHFYDTLGAKIDEKLLLINSTNDFKSWLLKQATFYYGQQNALFNWNDKVLEQLLILAQYANVKKLTVLLKAMAKDFKNLKDGFPDLMVLERDSLRFEEIKAPGDSLRRNQLVSINQLSLCGFDVDIQRTSWQFDPNQSYAVVDLETTGGKKELDRITEIGIVRIEQGKIVAKWQSLVNPQRRIPKYITQLTGINNEMVAQAPVFSDIASQVNDFCDNTIFVAHNVNFDMGFLKHEFQRVGMLFSKPKLCTVQLARKYLPGHPSYSLGNLCNTLNIELNQHHRALDDAMAAAEILLLVNEQRRND